MGLSFRHLPLVFFLLFICQVQGQESTSVWWKDFKSSLSYGLHGSYLQFQRPRTWTYLGLGAPYLGYTFHRDDKILQQYGRDRNHFAFDVLGRLGNVAHVAPFLTYYWGRRNNNSKLIQYSKEVLGTLALAQAETVALSFIRVHERPDQSDLDKLETTFRGDSSFPSGHVIPLAVLSFKTLQFYGASASLPLFLTSLAVGYERVQSRKHYWSDVVGAFILSGMASEGVRAAAGKKSELPSSRFLVTPYGLRYTYSY